MHSQVPITAQIKSVFRVGALSALSVLSLPVGTQCTLSFQPCSSPECVASNPFSVLFAFLSSLASVSRHGTDNALKYEGWLWTPAVHTYRTEGQTWNFYAYQTSIPPFISTISQLSLHWFALVLRKNSPNSPGRLSACNSPALASLVGGIIRPKWIHILNFEYILLY